MDRSYWLAGAYSLDLPYDESPTAFTKAGAQVHFEFMLYIPSVEGGDVRAAIILENPSPPKAGQPSSDDHIFRGILQTAAGEEVQGYNGSSHSNTGAKYVPDKWQKWELDYVIGADTYTVTVDGSRGTALALEDAFTAGGGDLIGVSFGHNGKGTYYIDAVPPPDPPANDDTFSK